MKEIRDKMRFQDKEVTPHLRGKTQIQITEISTSDNRNLPMQPDH